MNIAFFLDTYDEVNGVSVIYKEMIKWAYTVSNMKLHFFILSKKTKTTKKTIIGNVILHYLKPRVSFKNLLYPELVLGIPSIRYIKRIFTEVRFDIVFLTIPGIYSFIGKIFAEKHGIKCIGFYHTRLLKVSRIYGKKIGGVFFEKIFFIVCLCINKILYKNCITIFAQSEELKHEIKMFSKATVIVICTGVNRDIFFPSIEDTYVNRTLVYVGRVSLEKNLEVLFAINETLKKEKIDLIFVGDGPLATHYKKFGINITGFLSQEELNKILSNATAMVFPSKSDAFGNVIIESIACGIPIICAERTPCSRYLSNKKVSLTFDDKNLIEIVRKVFNKKEVWLELRHNTLNSKILEWNKVFEYMFEEIDKVLYNVI
jgi:glycosyltransferase involved in cell wall biosynthesis